MDKTILSPENVSKNCCKENFTRKNCCKATALLVTATIIGSVAAFIFTFSTVFIYPEIVPMAFKAIKINIDLQKNILMREIIFVAVGVVVGGAAGAVVITALMLVFCLGNCCCPGKKKVKGKNDEISEDEQGIQKAIEKSIIEKMLNKPFEDENFENDNAKRLGHLKMLGGKIKEKRGIKNIVALKEFKENYMEKGQSHVINKETYDKIIRILNKELNAEMIEIEEKKMTLPKKEEWEIFIGTMSKEDILNATPKTFQNIKFKSGFSNGDDPLYNALREKIKNLTNISYDDLDILINEKGLYLKDLQFWTDKKSREEIITGLLEIARERINKKEEVEIKEKEVVIEINVEEKKEEKVEEIKEEKKPVVEE